MVVVVVVMVVVLMMVMMVMVVMMMIMFVIVVVMVVMLVLLIVVIIVMVMVVLVLVVVIVMVMVVVLALVVVIIVVIVMMMVMSMLMFIVIFVQLLRWFVHFLYPCCGSSHGIKVEHAGMNNAVEIYVSVVAVDNLCLRLDSSYDLADMLQILRFHFRCFVQKDDVAELYLLYHKILNVLLIDVLLHEVIAAAEFVFHA